MIRRLIGSLVILALLALIIFLALGGRVHLGVRAPSADVKVDKPKIEVSPGRLPDVDVSPGGGGNVSVGTDKPRG